MLSLQNLLPPVFQSLCPLLRLLVPLWDIYQQVSSDLILLLLHQLHLPGTPPPPASAAPAGDSSSSSTTASTVPQPTAPAESEMQPPATAPAKQRPEPVPRQRRSPRLNPEPGRVCAIKGPPGNPPHQSQKAPRMARAYPLTVPYNQCLGARADPLLFASCA